MLLIPSGRSEARGLKNVIIENNQCRKSILAGGVDGLIVRGNTIEGRLVGNGNTNQIIEDNIVRASEGASSKIGGQQSFQ